MTELSSSNGSRFVVVEGMVGVGKTTFIESVKKHATSSGLFDTVVAFNEPISPLILEAYLHDRKKYALVFQHNVATKVLAQYEEAKRIVESQPRCLVILDRGINGNMSFAKIQHSLGFFSDLDYAIYKEEIGLFDGSLETLLQDPFIETLYLRCEPETAFRRMKKRGNASEVSSYTLDYFEALFKAHEEFIGNNTVGRVHIVDWEAEKDVESGLLQRKTVDEVLTRLKY